MMKSLKKTIILPLVALVCLMLKSTYDIDVKPEVQYQIADWVSTGIFGVYTAYGIFKNFKKEEK